MDHKNEQNERLYEAMVWPNGGDKPGERVSVYAMDLSDAKNQLGKKYGKGNVYNLRNPDDAAHKIR